MPETPPETSVVEHEVRVAARPETVFAYFTDPMKMVQWIGRGGHLDPRPGGVCRIAFAPSDAQLEYVVDYFGGGPEAQERARRNRAERCWASSWRWIRRAGSRSPGAGSRSGSRCLRQSTSVEVSLIPEGEDTILRLSHRRLPATAVGVSTGAAGSTTSPGSRSPPPVGTRDPIPGPMG